jgi:hypothetical protein
MQPPMHTGHVRSFIHCLERASHFERVSFGCAVAQQEFGRRPHLQWSSRACIDGGHNDMAARGVAHSLGKLLVLASCIMITVGLHDIRPDPKRPAPSLARSLAAATRRK